MTKFFEQIFKKGQQTEPLAEKSVAELTEEEIKEKLSKLGDIEELRKKMHSPFSRDSVTIEVLARLVIKLESNLSTYDTILSDDASGRLPSLFLRKLVDHARLKIDEEPVKTYFLATGRHSNIEKDKAIKRFLLNKKNEIGKALLVTEHIASGDSIIRIMKLLNELGINFEVACISACGFSEDYVEKFGDIFKKIYYGENKSRVGSAFYDYADSAGVSKDSSSASPHPEVYRSANKGDVARARKDANFLAEEFIDKLLD